ncbi:MAG: hypothetical protein JNG88_05405 [Phycisphaerales bacterium]|nr:hypothetical protein [Phycisphaerales bacterium]
MNSKRGLFGIIAGLLVSAVPALAQSTAITYQGRLEDAGAPANGLHDIRFRLFDASTGGAQVSETLCFEGVSVVDGLFTVPIDFGQQFITTGQRHLDIQVRREIGQPHWRSRPNGWPELKSAS